MLTRLRSLAREVLAALRGHDLMLYAAGLTFYAAIAVVPLMLIAVWGAGVLLGTEVVAGLASRLVEYVPEGMGLQRELYSLAEVGPRLNVAAVLAALVPASTYGEGLARILSRLAGTSPKAPGLRGRLKTLPLLAALPLMVAFGLLAVAVLPQVLGQGQGARLLGVYATFWVGWIASSLLLVVVYRSFTDRPLSAWALFWGPASTGSFLTGMTLGWVLLLEFGLDVGRAYGGSMVAGIAVLVALYLFLVQIVSLVGYVLTLRLADRRDGTAADGRDAGEAGGAEPATSRRGAVPQR